MVDLNVSRETDLQRQVEQFLYHEAELLDGWSIREWFDLFADPCLYWVPVLGDDYDPKVEPSLLYAERKLLGDLVERILHPAAHSQTPRASYRRIVGNVRIRSATSEEVHAVSNFMLFESRLGGERTLGGTYEHRIVTGGGAWKIAMKKATLANSGEALTNLSMFFL